MRKKILGIAAALSLLAVYGVQPSAQLLPDADICFSITANAADTETSGKCGENLTWELDSTGTTLTIKGTGAMYDWETAKSPWYSNRTIQTVSLPDGLTNIGNYAFGYCSSITSINIPDTVTSIGVSAFHGCSKHNTT